MQRIRQNEVRCLRDQLRAGLIEVEWRIDAQVRRCGFQCKRVAVEVQPADAQRCVSGDICSGVELQDCRIVKVHISEVKGAPEFERTSGHPQRRTVGSQ